MCGLQWEVIAPPRSKSPTPHLPRKHNQEVMSLGEKTTTFYEVTTNMHNQGEMLSQLKPAGIYCCCLPMSWDGICPDAGVRRVDAGGTVMELVPAAPMSLSHVPPWCQDTHRFEVSPGDRQPLSPLQRCTGCLAPRQLITW